MVLPLWSLRGGESCTSGALALLKSLWLILEEALELGFVDLWCGESCADDLDLVRRE